MRLLLDVGVPYCDYCEARSGHTFRTCPRRDDTMSNDYEEMEDWDERR